MSTLATRDRTRFVTSPARVLAGCPGSVTRVKTHERPNLVTVLVTLTQNVNKSENEYYFKVNATLVTAKNVKFLTEF